MNWNIITGVILSCGLVLGTTPDLFAAPGDGGKRGGGGGGGGNRSSGGGGNASRSKDSGSNKNLGSVRNNGGSQAGKKPSQQPARQPGQNKPQGGRDKQTPSQLPVRQPGQDKPQGGRDNQKPTQLPAKSGDRYGKDYRPGQGQRPGGENRPGQGQRPDGENRPGQGQRPGGENRPGRGDRLEGKPSQPGLKPSQLPADRNKYADSDWKKSHGGGYDSKKHYNKNHYNKNYYNKNYYNKNYYGYKDSHWHSVWWYGNPVSRVSYNRYLSSSIPCQTSVSLLGGTRYYYCDTGWYQPVFVSGKTQYVVVSPPAGAQFSTIADPQPVAVGGNTYYVSNNTFYQQQKEDAETVYTTVVAPLGAEVDTIPDYAIEVEKDGQIYYRYDQIFYQVHGDKFVVVADPWE